VKYDGSNPSGPTNIIERKLTMLDGSHYFECQCESFEHNFRVVVDKEDECVYVDTHLNPWMPWYRRLYYATRYALGLHTGKWYPFTSTVLKKEDIERLIKVLEEAKKLP
jgi:hypothetical protein